jgi:ribosomal protein S18 acetylase RimI-like enzyme
MTCQGIGQGFVGKKRAVLWVTSPCFPRACRRIWAVTVVANVAVHPDLQRRGIGRQLMETSLEALRASGTRCAILQVDHDNDVARRLYERLGFKPERTWNQWRRGPSQSVPSRGATAPRLTLRPATRWREEYALAERVFPQARGGLGWQRPLHPREFTRSPWQAVLDGLGGTTVERWIVLDMDRIAGALWARTSLMAGQTQLTLIVHPDWQGRLEDTLINYAVRRLAADYRPLAVEHPADDLAATLAFERYGFVKRRTLQHMRLDF